MLNSSEILEFDPVLYSMNDNQFLLDNLGKPTVVALKSAGPTVSVTYVKELLDRVNDLEELKKHNGTEWIGVEAMKAAIHVWFRENAKWKADYIRTNKRAPRWPSLYSFDVKGRAHRGGPGSDSGRVRTYFDEKGNRHPFAVMLLPEFDNDWKAPTQSETSSDKYLIENPELVRFDCLVPVEAGRPCGHTESYKADSRASRAAARARMSKHLRKATENVEGHRETYSNEFGS